MEHIAQCATNCDKILLPKQKETILDDEFENFTSIFGPLAQNFSHMFAITSNRRNLAPEPREEG